MELISLVFIAIFAFLPILLWGYIFSYLDNSPLNAGRFVMGIVAGGISVIPVLYLKDILDSLHLASFNIFPLLALPDNTSALFFAFVFTVIVIALFIGLVSFGLFFSSTIQSLRTFWKNLFLLGLLGALYTLFHTLVEPLQFLDVGIRNGGVTFVDTVFDTFKLVLFYYLVIGVIEETSKHFSVVTSSVVMIDTVKK